MRPSANIYCKVVYKKTELGTWPHMLGNGSHVFIIHDYGYANYVPMGRLGWGICLYWPFWVR